MSDHSLPRSGVLPLLRFAGAAALVVALAACGETAGGLAPGLSASMEAPGASLDRASAFGILNHYRSTTGAAPLTDDAGLAATAQRLVQAYAATGKVPALPPGVTAMRASAGYTNFADTFSGWRNTPADAAVLADRSASRGGLATVYDARSNYGVYWILVLGS